MGNIGVPMEELQAKLADLKEKLKESEARREAIRQEKRVEYAKFEKKKDEYLQLTKKLR